VLISPHLSSPILFGHVHPRIVLPAKVSADLPGDQLQAIFLHELTHLQRGDIWVNWLQMILQAVYWFHPLVWFANARLRWERELCVDDIVLFHLRGECDAYGASLLVILKNHARRRLVTLGYVGVAEAKSGMPYRLRRILNPNRRLSVRLGWRRAVLLVGLGLILIPQARSQVRPGVRNAEEARVLYLRAREEAKAGNADEAAAMFAEVVRGRPKGDWAGRALGQIAEIRWRQGQYDKGIDACQGVLWEYPASRYANGEAVAPTCAYRLAMCYYKNGQRDHAMWAFADAVEKYPDARVEGMDTGKRYADLFREMMGRGGGEKNSPRTTEIIGP